MLTTVRISDARLGLIPAGPLPSTWNDWQQAVMQSVGLGSDWSDSADNNNDM